MKLRKTRWAQWYTLATIAMFTSTTIYWAFIIRDTFTVAGIATFAVDSLVSAEASVQNCVQQSGGECSVGQFPEDVSYAADDVFRLAYHDLPQEYCAGTAALTTNVCSSFPRYRELAPYN